MQTACDGKMVEHWLKRMGITAATVAAGFGVGAAIALAAGVLAPPALPAVAVGMAASAAGSMFILYCRLRSALQGAAQMALLELGFELGNDTWLKSLAQRRADAAVEKYTRAFDLTPEEIVRVRAEVDKVKVGRVKEFWQKQAKVELATGVVSSAVTTAIGFALGASWPIVLVPCAAGLVGSLGVTLWEQYAKLSIALDSTALMTIAALRKLPPVHPNSMLARRTRAKTERIVDKYVHRYRMNEAERRELEQKANKVRDLKLDEFVRKRRPAFILGPTGRQGGIAIAGIASGATQPHGAITAAILTVMTALQSSYLLYRRFDQAVEGVVAATSKEIAARRPPGLG